MVDALLRKEAIRVPFFLLLFSFQSVLSATTTNDTTPRVKSENEIYTSNNPVADGLEYLAGLARLPVAGNARQRSGRQRSAGGAAVNAMARAAATSTLTNQVCSPVCKTVGAVSYSIFQSHFRGSIRCFVCQFYGPSASVRWSIST